MIVLLTRDGKEVWCRDEEQAERYARALGLDVEEEKQAARHARVLDPAPQAPAAAKRKP